MNWLSRYRPRYLRALVYMLQATEYHPEDYLKWYGRTADFNRVERRGKLVRTTKSLALLAVATSMYAALAIGSAALAMYPGGWLGLTAAVGGLLATPVLTAWLLPIPVIIGQWLVQVPLDRREATTTRAALLKHPALRIAIAGSFGKTSMREIIKTIVSAGRTVAAPPHSFNTPSGIARFVAGLSGHEQVLVFELGEYYPGDVLRLAELVMPKLGVITGVNEAHLSKFRSLDKTTATIFELADYLHDESVYVNGESQLASAAARPSHLCYNQTGVAGWIVSHAHSDLEGTRFTLRGHGVTLKLHCQLLGLHQIGPITAAVDIAHRLGLTPEQITAGVAQLQPFAHRLEQSVGASGVIMLDDSYNGNPSGVAAVIAFLAGLKGHRRLYVTPGLVEMGHKGREVHRDIGRRLAAAGIEQVILIRTSATPDIADGLEAADYRGTITWQPDMPTAIANLPHLTVKNDVVLIQNDWPDQYL